MQRLTSILLTFIVMAAAHGQEQRPSIPVHVGPSEVKLPHGWSATFVTDDGATMKIGEWNTFEECQADLKRQEKAFHVTSGQCMKTPPPPQTPVFTPKN